MEPHRENLLRLLDEGRVREAFDLILKGFRIAAKEGSDASHALGLEVADGRAGEPTDPAEEPARTPDEGELEPPTP